MGREFSAFLKNCSTNVFVIDTHSYQHSVSIRIHVQVYSLIDFSGCVIPQNFLRLPGTLINSHASTGPYINESSFVTE